MERRVPYRNDILITGFMLFLLGIIWLCIAASKPQLYVAANDPNLLKMQGICYYNYEPFTGCIYERYPNGNYAIQRSFVNGKQDGITQAWYPNKVMREERLFADGRKEGIHKGWYEDGTKKFEYQFEDDEYNGVVKEWFPNGKPLRTFHYKMGHEDGFEQMWWDNGIVRANYVVKDNQQYGLFGRKICKSIVK